MIRELKYRYNINCNRSAIRYSLLIIVFAFCNNSWAQEIKKSKEITTIEGKKYYVHIVEKGQTLYAIAHAYELKVNDIVIENPNSIDGIKPGESLRIPFAKDKEKAKIEVLNKKDSLKYYFHQVQQGETLFSLSKFYGLSIDKLKELNPEIKDGLKIGQSVKIPVENKPETIARTEVPIQKSDLNKKQNNFNIALFLPFHSGELNDTNMESMPNAEPELPAKSDVAIQFYQGVKMALDSLKKSGLRAKVFVYDMDENDSVQFRSLLKRPELKTMDLMIGPLYSSNFLPLSKFAKENQIFIISPLSQQNKILFNNPYVSKVTASFTTQTEQMAEYIVKKYKGENIVVINSGNTKDAALVKSFVLKANILLGKVASDSVSEVRGFVEARNLIHTSGKNIVVVPSNNRTFVTDFITKLNLLHEKNEIILFGLDSWADFDNLDLDYLSNMQMHYPCPAFIDYDNLQVKKFICQFVSRYGSDPEAFAFQGFDVTFFYLNLLRDYGINLQNKLALTKLQGLHTAFDFYQVSPESGFENKGIFMLMLQDYKLLRAD
jgi:LysM repeat protein/ABC-type branched-subunit amino acid transport system substrate-binding protein